MSLCKNAVVILSLLATASLPRFAGATTYVVNGASAAASDSNPGTAAQPFKTIQHAADTAAQPGDTVEIMPGKYAETVTVKHSGATGKPILFEAATWHGVTIVAPDEQTYTLFQPGQGTERASNITVRGIVFGHTAFRGWSGNNDFPSTVVCAHGWQVEDCVLRDNMGLSFATHGTEDSDDVTLLRTIFEQCSPGGVGASGDGADHRLKNPHVLNCIFRRNNPKNLDPGGYNGANKFLWHDGLVMDGVISYDNNGAGSWLDYGSINFYIRNCTFFGNHAGYFLDLSGKPGGNSPWAGAGFWSEANPGPGTIEGNTVYSNLGCGIGDLDSGSIAALQIQDNALIDNGGSGIEFRGMDDKSFRRLGQATVIRNQFKDNHIQWSTSVEQNIPAAIPAAMGIFIDGNTYDVSDSSAPWVSWKPTSAAQPVTAANLADIRKNLKTEDNGHAGKIAFRGPLVKVEAYPTEADAANPDPSKLFQVHAPEDQSIDNAIGQAKVGSEVVIPIFGHLPIRPTNRGDAMVCEVYDLQARYLLLTINSGLAAGDFTGNITTYTTIKPTKIRVKLTKNDPYDVEATLIEVEGVTHVQPKKPHQPAAAAGAARAGHRAAGRTSGRAVAPPASLKATPLPSTRGAHARAAGRHH